MQVKSGVPGRPNVLFLMSDEHRPDVTGYEGNGVIRTPTLDWLAETGVVFRNAYTPSPICIPGRQCMMAGQLPRTARCERFGQDLPPFSMTWAQRFAQAGYRTVCCGKLHHTGPDQMQGWTDRPIGDLELGRGHIAGMLPDQTSPTPEQGIGKWCNQKEIERAGVNVGYHVRRDANWTRTACDELEEYLACPAYDRPKRHMPLLFKLSLLQPHYPFFTDEERFLYYLHRVETFQDQARFPHPKLSRTQAPPDVEASDRDVRRATAAYYGMIDAIDTHYGSVLDKLRHLGEDLDDWIIIYTSDHGDMLGEHGIWEKTQFFEASARVPLIIRWPRRFAPRVVKENVNLCDLFATLCDLAGVPLPEEQATVHAAGLDSRSLVPLMEGHAAAWHERYHDETISQCHGRDLMIKRGTVKYLSFRDADGNDLPEVLFDLEADPTESRNLIDEPRYGDLLPAFRARRDELGFGPGGPGDYRNAGYAS